MGVYVSGAHGVNEAAIDAAIDRALRVLRQHHPDP